MHLLDMYIESHKMVKTISKLWKVYTNLASHLFVSVWYDFFFFSRHNQGETVSISLQNLYLLALSLYNPQKITAVKLFYKLRDAHTSI